MQACGRVWHQSPSPKEDSQARLLKTIEPLPAAKAKETENLANKMVFACHCHLVLWLMASAVVSTAMGTGPACGVEREDLQRTKDKCRKYQ